MTAQKPITYDFKSGRKFRLKRTPRTLKGINQEKVERVIVEKEKNIELEIESERIPDDVIYIVGQTVLPKVKINRQLERQLYSALSMEERVEFSSRCKEKARAAWKAGDSFKKHLWGGW
jgi:hypothetical protein